MSIICKWRVPPNEWVMVSVLCPSMGGGYKRPHRQEQHPDLFHIILPFKSPIDHSYQDSVTQAAMHSDLQSGSSSSGQATV